MRAYLRNNVWWFGLVVLASPALAEDVDLSQPPAAVRAKETDVITSPEMQKTKETVTIRTDKPIEINDYEAPQSGGLGLWSDDRVGIAADIWQSVSEKDLLTRLSQLPAQVESPAIRNLIVRLLVMETSRSDLSEAVLTARIEALLKMGQASLARQLLESIPASLLSDVLQRQLYLLKVFTTDTGEAACQEADTIQSEKPDAFWQRFQVLCYAKQGDRAKAALGLELLREQNDLPEPFEAILQYALDAKTNPLELKTLPESREALAWLVFAGKLPEKLEGLQLRRLALLQKHAKLSDEDKQKIRQYSVNADTISKPHGDTPDIPLSVLHLKTRAGADAVPTRKALMALVMRRSWEMPVPVEVEDDLRGRSYRGEVTENSLIWRETSAHLQENEQPLAALMALLVGVEEPLFHYTTSDIAFLVDELRSLGLPEDAAAMAEEAIQGE